MNKWMIGSLLSASLFFSSHAFSDSMVTKVIDLNYVQANKVLELIQPLLQPDEKVSGSGQTLVVNVSPETLTQIRTVLHKLDVPPTTFQIAIHQGTADWLNSEDDGDVIYSTSSKNTMQQDQSVNVMNGAAAFVSTGEEVPILSAVGADYFMGVSYQQHKVETGFLIKPYLQGSQVKLTIKRSREQQNQQAFQQFDNQQVETTIMAPLNQWVTLGSAQGPVAQPSTVQTYRAGNKFAHAATLYIKVSVLSAPDVGNADAR